MKHALFSFVLISIVMVTFGSHATAQTHHDHQGHHEHGAIMEAEGDEVICPVTNRVMKKGETQVSYTLYFASEPAKEAFLKNPAKFLTATCSVMGGEASKLTAPYSNYGGVAYYFCCAGCKEQFEKEPKKYIGKTPKKSEMDSHSEMMGKSTTASAMTCGASSRGCSSAKLEKGLKDHTCGMSQKVGATSCSLMKVEGTASTDPVCGMKILSLNVLKGKYKGTTYNFCSAECKQKFERTPEKYIEE